LNTAQIRLYLGCKTRQTILPANGCRMLQDVTEMKDLLEFYKRCRKSESNFLFIAIRFILHRLIHHKALLLHQHVKLKGVKNIEANGRIEVGLEYVGFMHRTDKTYLHIQGKLRIGGNYSIGRGCRFDIGENATVTIGNGGYMNCMTNLIIMHELSIGDNCAIAWNCQFLDENFHMIDYPDKRDKGNSITIGDNVWIGCGVKIYQGTIIPDGCVIASDSVVRGIFSDENCLIAGNPAKIIKQNIHWRLN
jgi:acetyltransferase-like isoleucine patch superfamily enzyme